MPSEAINLRSQTACGPGLYQRLLNGVPIASSPLDNSAYADRTEYLVKPATVVNPVRADGTRQMSAYDTIWFRGQNPGTVTSHYPLSSYVEKFTLEPRVLIRNETNSGNYPGLANSFLQVPPSDVLACNAEATTKTLSKLSQKKWDLGVTALELKQTAGLVTDLATGMSKTVLSMMDAHRRSKKVIDRFFRSVQRHGDFYQAAAEAGMRDISLLTDLRERWMQYQFGIKPLVHDIYDSSEALSTLLFLRGFPLLAVAKSGAERKSRIRLAQPDLPDAVDRVLLGESEVRVHYSVVYEIPLGNTGPLNTLGLDNPYSVGWEATRLSWMVDYVVGIGDWLSSLTATNGMLFREGCKSELRRCVFHTSNVSKSFPSATVDSKPSVPCYVESGRFTRSLIPSYGLLPAMVPSIRRDLGLTQLGNSLFALSHVMSGRAGMR